VTPEPQAVVLAKKSCDLLAVRFDALEARIASDDETAWPDFLDLVKTLAALFPHVSPGAHGSLLTTRDMAAKLGISPKTLLKRKRSGEIRPAVQMAARGRAAIRWAGDERPNGNGGGNARGK
jgi:hypothetical protein